MTSRSCSLHVRHWAAGVLLALLVLTAVAAAPLACAGVRLPDGEWFEQTDDLAVKVMGGYAAVSRTWLNNRWYFNPAWARLAFKYDGLGQISSIERAGWSYQAHGPGLWAFDNKNSIVATASGYRWQDRRGNSVDYDASGRILAYADRNSVKVTFIQDQANRITGVFDHFGHQVLWFEYSIAADQVLALQVTGGVDVSLPSAIRDASGRRVEYRYTSGRLTSVIDVFGNAWNYGYDTAGRLVSVTDPENRSTSVAYAANGRVSAVTHADATVTAYGYDYDSAKRQVYVQLRHPGGRQEQMWYGLDGALRRHEIAGQLRMQLAVDSRTLVRTGANGATTREAFDEWDNLVKRTHPDGGVELFEREPRFSEVSRYVDENGNETRYEYDARGNQARRVEAAGTPQARTTEYSYDQYGNRLLARRLGDSVTVEASYNYEYDQAGNLVAVTEPEGNVSRYGYDAQGNLLSFSDGRNRTWAFSYDAAGRMLAETDPHGQSERYSLDRVGNVVGYTDRRGQTWRFEYDPRDRPTARTDPLGNVARTQYDPEGFPIRLTDEEGRSQDLAYDPLKRLSAARDGRGNVVELRYPREPGNETSSFGPNSIVYPTFEQAFSYDARNRLTGLSDILGAEVRPIRYRYDAAGNRIATINAENRATSYVYDALNRLVRVTDSLGHVTELAYDNRDNLIAVTDPNGHSWRFEYDRNNRRSKEIKPLGEVTLYRYDPADELVELIDAKGQHLIYDYDGSGRLNVERHYTTAPTAAIPVKQIGYAYDAAGNLTAWNDGEQSGALVYDALSRLASETIDYGSFSLTYSYSYHANGLKKSLTYPGGATYTYSYDARNGLAAIEMPGEGSITVNELNWTVPTQVTLPGGTVQTHTFDGLLRPTAQEVTSPAAQRLLTVTSEYSSLRQVLRRDIDGVTSQFSYDSELRLLEAVSSDGRQESYTLDAAANRLTDRAGPGSWDYDANNQLLRAGDTVYAYDAAGNVTTRTQGIQVTRFFYDVSNRLIRIEDGAGSVIARYGYDPTGRRLWKRTGESITYFLYAQEGLIGEYNAAGQETAAYGWRPDGVWGTNPLFYKLGGRVFYAHTDHLGAPLKLTDKAGNVVWAATYSAFGQATISAAATVAYNLRLPGQYFDRETGLHYNWQRYYEVGTGRYLSEDLYPLRGVANQFAYAFANPLYFADPTGLYPTCRSAILKVRTNAYTDTETTFRYQYEKIVLLPAGVGLTHDLDPRHPRKPPLTLELKVEVALVEITGIDETDFFVHQVFQDLLVSCEETTIDACGRQRTRIDPPFTMTIQIENSRTQVGKPRFHERIIKKKTYFEFGI